MEKISYLRLKAIMDNEDGIFRFVGFLGIFRGWTIAVVERVNTFQQIRVIFKETSSPGNPGLFFTVLCFR